MSSVNKAFLVGNLGRDPELRTTSSGKQWCTFTLATTDRWTDEDGQKQEQTVWHNIVAWGRQAEVIQEYLHKGSLVHIEGRIVNRSYDDKDGNRRYISEIVVQNLQFLGGKNDLAEKEDRPAKSSKREYQRPKPPRRYREQSDLPF